MDQKNLKKQFLTMGFIFSLFLGHAQASTNTDDSKIITFKFSEYSVEKDKIIQQEFSKKDGFKSVYTCIPAGIIVFGTDKTITVTEKEMIISKINSLKKVFNYEVLEGMTLSDAEKNCSLKRDLEK